MNIWLPWNESLAQFLERYEVPFRKYQGYHQIDDNNLIFNYQHPVDGKPIIFLIMQEFDLVNMYPKIYKYHSFQCIVHYLIRQNFNSDILKSIFPKLDSSALLTILKMINYNSIDLEIVQIVIQNYLDNLKQRVSSNDKIIMLSTKVIKESDNLPVFKLFMETFENIDNKTLKEIFGLAVKYLRAEITQCLITERHCKLTIAHGKEIDKLIGKDITNGAKFITILVELYDSGYIQKFNWSNIAQIVKKKYPKGSVDLSSIPVK
jgi:hypothetical protein